MNRCKNVSCIERDLLKTSEEIDVIIRECDQKLNRMGIKLHDTIKEKINCLEQEQQVMVYKYDIFEALLDINIEKSVLLEEAIKRLKDSELSDENNDLSDINSARRHFSTKSKYFNKKGKFLLSRGDGYKNFKVAKIPRAIFGFDKIRKSEGNGHPGQFIATTGSETQRFHLPNQSKDGRASLEETILAMEKYLATIVKEGEEAVTKLELVRRERYSLKMSLDEICEVYSRLVEAMGEQTEVSWLCDIKCIELSSKIAIIAGNVLKSLLDISTSVQAKMNFAMKLGKSEEKVPTRYSVRETFSAMIAACDSCLCSVPDENLVGCDSIVGQLAGELDSAKLEYSMTGLELLRRTKEFLLLFELDVMKYDIKLKLLTLAHASLVKVNCEKFEDAELIEKNIRCVVHQLHVVECYIFLVSAEAGGKYERIKNDFNRKLLEERVKLATAVELLCKTRQDPIELALSSKASQT